MSPRARRRARELLVPLQALPLPGAGERITEKAVLAAAAANEKVAATSAARELAWRKGIVLHRVFAAGTHVEAGEIEALPAAPLRSDGERVAFTSAQRAAAERAAYAQRWIPQLDVEMPVLAEPLLDLLRRLRHDWGKGHAPSVEDVFIRALGLLLVDEAFKAFRAVSDGRDLVYRGRIAVGFSVPLTDGTCAMPVVHAPGELPAREIAAMTRELAARARQGKLRPAEQSGALVSLVSLSSAGVSAFRAPVRPGEAATLSLPSAQPRPVWSGSGGLPDEIGSGMLATIEPTWQLSLTVDQRLVDAPLAAAFLGKLKELLEAPKRLL